MQVDTMTDELKPLPCPFCGSIPSMDDVIGEYIEGSLYVRLRCPNGDIECLTEGPWVGFGISDDDYPVDAVTLYESAVSVWNRRVEPPDIPGWLKEKITERINQQYRLGESGYQHTIRHLEWVLSLRREDAE